MSPRTCRRLVCAWLLAVSCVLPPAAPTDDAPREAHGVFGVWTPRGVPPALAPADLPLTGRAREAALEDDAVEDDAAPRCDPPGMPGMLDTTHPIEFVDEGGRILMRYEEWGAVRTVYLPPSRPPVEDRSPKGSSFGRWEGETLAIFTLYIDYPYFDELGTPQTESVTVLERYTPSADGTRLDWQATVTDPATFTAPVARSGDMTSEPGQASEPYDCAPSGG